MRHNQQVAHNIRQIKEQVEAAESQDDLVKVIEGVDFKRVAFGHLDHANSSVEAAACFFDAFGFEHVERASFQNPVGEVLSTWP